MRIQLIGAVLLSSSLTCTVFARDKSAQTDSNKADQPVGETVSAEELKNQDAAKSENEEAPASETKSAATGVPAESKAVSDAPAPKPEAALPVLPKTAKPQAAVPASPKPAKPQAAAPASPKPAKPVPAPVRPPVKTEAPEAEANEPEEIEPLKPFQEGWDEATPDEKALFLEIYGESRTFLKEQWDKATPEERRKFLGSHPLLSERSLKHTWVHTSPEERAAFLEAHPKTREKIKEGWNGATPEQRETLAKEHSYLSRKALYHSWSYATPQEKIAYLDAHPDLRAQLKSRWIKAGATQKEWYEQNYAGLADAFAHGKPWFRTTTLERVAFLEANPAIADKLREAWLKNTPEMRAQWVRRWSGWPLRAYTTKTEPGPKAAAPHAKKHGVKSTKKAAP